MKHFSWLLAKHTVGTVVPYFIFSWILLSVILFVQQGSRFSDVFFSSSVPKNLIWQLTFALLPNIVAFTCPMAILVGVIIGLSKLRGDSELISIKAAGVGNLQIAVPVIFLGIILSIFTVIINAYGIPLSAQIVRKVALQTAIYKLESPIEPGVFNTDINGFTIYVKNGDIENGTWENIFIYNQDEPNGLERLITSKSGRIDTKNDVSELVLDNALVNTFSIAGEKKLVSENVSQIRFAIKTKRGELIDKLSNTEETSEELGLRQLISAAKSKEGKERIELEIIWHRRIVLSITPLIFALLGTCLVLKFNRGGRGFGVFLALVSLIVYYLITLLGEQLARTGRISVLTSSLLPVLASGLFIMWFFLSAKSMPRRPLFNLREKIKLDILPGLRKTLRTNFYINFTGGLLDFDIITGLLNYFFLTLTFLAVIFQIFTAFELWKFAGDFDNGLNLLIKYLFFLFPYIYIQLAPSALMIATLTIFVIKSRQNEIVTWTAAGRSVYRLLFPCFVLMLFLGFVNWEIQERILPESNQIQESLRTQIRNRGISKNKDEKFWVSDNKRIYSFEAAADRAQNNQKVKNVSVYEFSDDFQRLLTIYRAPVAFWENGQIEFSEKGEQIFWNNGKIDAERIGELKTSDEFNPFAGINQKTSYLDAEEIKRQIAAATSESERRNSEIALEKRYTTLFLPFVITLFTAPFALSLHRKGRVVTVGYAVALWLLFMGVTSVFEQFGHNNYISPKLAVWSPLLLFSLIGTFLISKIKT